MGVDILDGQVSVSFNTADHRAVARLRILNGELGDEGGKWDSASRSFLFPARQVEHVLKMAEVCGLEVSPQVASLAVDGAEASTDALSDRLTNLSDYVGQDEAVGRLKLVLAGAAAQGRRPPHILLSGAPGLGKTTLAGIVADELGAVLRVTTGPSLRKVGDLTGILLSIKASTVLFCDEVHRLPIGVEEALYEALEDFNLTIVTGSGADARAVTRRIEPFTFVGATTRLGQVSKPLRDRCGFQAVLRPYTVAELAQIVQGVWERARWPAEPGAAEAVAQRGRGVPRVTIHLAHRVMDLAAVAEDVIDADLAVRAMDMFGVGPDGLTEVDERILEALVLTFNGQPVGLEALAQALDIDRYTLEDEHEGFLARQGLIVRTKRGRQATPQATRTLGLN